MKNLYIIVISLFALISCNKEKEISIEIPEKPSKLVLYSTFDPYTPPSFWADSIFASEILIKLSDTKNIFDTTATIIEEAIVEITINDSSTYTAKFNDTTKTYYIYTPIYTKDKIAIKATKEGYEPVYSETIIPTKVPIDNVSISPNAYKKYDYLVANEVNITFTDPEDEINYYEICAGYPYYSPFTTTTSDITSNDNIITSQPYFPGKFDNGYLNISRLLFTDETFNGKEKTIQCFYYESSDAMDEWRTKSVHLTSVTEDYYNFMTTQIEQENNRFRDKLFHSDIVSDVYSNIENGYGFFSAYQTSSYHFIIDKGVVTENTSIR